MTACLLALVVFAAAPPSRTLLPVPVAVPAGVALGSAVFSPDGGRLAAGGGDAKGGIICHWRADTGRSLGPWRAGRFTGSCLAWWPEGGSMYSITAGRPTRWDDGGIEDDRHAPAQKMGGAALAFVTAWPRLLVTVPGAVHSWDLESRTAEPPLIAPGKAAHAGPVSADGRLWACLDHQDVDLYHLGTRKVERTLPGHEGRVWAAAFSPDGRRLACVGNLRGEGGWRATAYLWDTTAGKRLHAARLPAGLVGRAVALSADRFAVLASEGEAGPAWLIVLDVADGGEAARVGLPPDAGAAKAVAFSPDGRRLAACLSRRIALWRVAAR